jgi:Transposase DDE domain group 1
VHSAEGWEELLLPEIERQRQMGNEIAFRGNAAFARLEVYEVLEARGVKYAIWIPVNNSLGRDVGELLPRPVGPPSLKSLAEYKRFFYRAANCKTARRAVAKVEHHAGKLFPRGGFIVTHLTVPSRAVVRLYNKRGTSEQWIKEGSGP